jgi:DNA gyrase subunit B
MSDLSDPKIPLSSARGADAYDASQIQKLEGLEGVRKRPDMYIGDTAERGLHHCVFEVVDNSIDEALAGFAKTVRVSIHLDGSCSVEDDGRGIPVDMHPVYKIPALELVLTNLHAGGKFGKGAYQVSGGLHGVGAKCVNAVSEWFEAEVRRNGKVYQMRFAQGKTDAEDDRDRRHQEDRHEDHVQARPRDLSDHREFQYEILAKRLRELAFLNPGHPHRPGGRALAEDETFFFKDGIAEFVRYLNQNKNVLHDKPITFTDSVGDGGSVEAAHLGSTWRCSTTTATTIRSLPTPTRSSTSRAAPTSPASAPPSPAWSTTSPSRTT